MKETEKMQVQSLGREDSLEEGVVTHSSILAPLSMGFPRQEYWSGLPFPSPGNFPNSEIELGSPAVQAESLLTEPSGNQTVQGWDFMDALLNRKEAEAQRRKVMCLSALSKSATEFK